MSSPGQKRGSCGHAMASFDGNLHCARCRDKGKGKDTCVESKNSCDCVHCNALTPEQRAQLATPSYKLKKEKREAKKLETDTVHQDTESLVDPSAVSVIGPVEGLGTVKSPSLPPEKKPKKDKPKRAASSTSTDGKIADLDFKWSERFNRLEALLLAKSFPPSFSSDVRVTPHSPPPNVGKDTEPFFQPTTSSIHVECTGPDFPVEKQLSAGKLLPQDTVSKRTGPDIKDAEKLQSAGKLLSDLQPQGSGSSRRTGPDIKVAAKHQSAGKLHHSTTGRSGPDKLVPRQQSTGKPSTDLPSTDLSHRPRPSSLTGSSSPTLHKSARRDSISSVELATESELSDQPPVELFVEEGELSDNPELELEQAVSEEQTYRETMRGICSYMG